MINKEIKKTLIDKDMTITDLAKETGYTRAHMSKIINEHIKSPKAEKLIAFVLGTSQAMLSKHNEVQK